MFISVLSIYFGGKMSELLSEPQKLNKIIGFWRTYCPFISLDATISHFALEVRLEMNCMGFESSLRTLGRSRRRGLETRVR